MKGWPTTISVPLGYLILAMPVVAFALARGMSDLIMTAGKHLVWLRIRIDRKYRERRIKQYLESSLVCKTEILELLGLPNTLENFALIERLEGPK
jgi:hypothetical protein